MPILKEAKALDIYELRAIRDGGVPAVGEYLDTIGITDLALMDELDAAAIVKYAWLGTVKKLRELIEEYEGAVPPREDRR